jgi:hypothetical protein
MSKRRKRKYTRRAKPAAPAVSQADGFADHAPLRIVEASPAPALAGVSVRLPENHGGDENLDAACGLTDAEVFAQHNGPNCKPGQGCICDCCKRHRGEDSPNAAL